jgi:hypothetical protein
VEAATRPEARDDQSFLPIKNNSAEYNKNLRQENSKHKTAGLSFLPSSDLANLQQSWMSKFRNSRQSINIPRGAAELFADIIKDGLDVRAYDVSNVVD